MVHRYIFSKMSSESLVFRGFNVILFDVIIKTIKYPTNLSSLVFLYESMLNSPQKTAVCV